MSARVINIKSGEPYDVYIGRANRRYGLAESVWANPYKVGRDGAREEVIEKYARHLIEERPDLLARLPELEGKTLGCWCAPERCHGDVLVLLLELDTTNRSLREALDFINDDRNLTEQGRDAREVLLGDIEAILQEHRLD